MIFVNIINPLIQLYGWIIFYMFAIQNKYMNLNKLWIINAAVICALCVTNLITCSRNSDLEKHMSDAMVNQKAYVAENAALHSTNRAFKLTIDQLNYYNDSLTQQMNDIRKELRIKDKQLKSISYISNSVSSTDTIVFRDTLFSTSLDTTIQNEWYRLKISILEPKDITVSPTFKNNFYIVTSQQKETINPPKKFPIFRWFQKKHTVVTINVVDESPYVYTDHYRFIEIIK